MPFITPPSPYLILGSNITGGAPNLIVNNGINNMALGNFVLTNNDDGDNNIGIGNLSLNSNLSGSRIISIGVSSSFSNLTGNDLIVLGNETLLNHESLTESVVIGNFSLPYGTNLDAESNSKNTVIGDRIMSSSVDTIFGNIATFFSNTIVGSRILFKNTAFVSAAAVDINSNVFIGDRVLQDSDLSDYLGNVIIGQGAAANIINGVDATVMENNLIVGKDAAAKRFLADGNTDYDFSNHLIIGNGAGAATIHADSVNPNTVIGNGALRATSEEITELTLLEAKSTTAIGYNTMNVGGLSSAGTYELNKMLMIGNKIFDSILSTNGLAKDMANSIIIGENITADNVTDFQIESSIFIGNNIVIPDGSEAVLYIGDPETVYASVVVGGVDLLAGGATNFIVQSDSDMVGIVGNVVNGANNNSYETVLTPTEITSGFELNDGTNVSGKTEIMTSVSYALDSTVSTADFTISIQEAYNNDDGVVQSAYIESILDPALNAYKEFGMSGGSLSLNVGVSDGLNDVVCNLNLDADSGVGSFIFTGAELDINFGNVSLNELRLTTLAETGTDTATFVATNAPAAIAPTNWISITLNGVVGYIPFFS